MSRIYFIFLNYLEKNWIKTILICFVILKDEMLERSLFLLSFLGDLKREFSEIRSIFAQLLTSLLLCY